MSTAFRCFVLVKPDVSEHKFNQLFDSPSGAPDRSPYGFHHARHFSWDVSFSPERKYTGFLWFLRKLFRYLMSMELVHAWSNRREMSKCCAIWTVTEEEYLAVLFLIWAGFLPKSLCVISNNVWLFDRLPRWPRWKQRIVLYFAKQAKVITFHSHAHIAAARTYLPKSDLRFVPFGVCAELYTRPQLQPAPVKDPNESVPLKILSLGNDASRDWNVLLRAFGNDLRFDLTIVCRTLPDSITKDYSNVSLSRPQTLNAVRDLYFKTDIVIITLAPNCYSGITVALEAAGLSVPVICTNTGGVPSYFSDGEMIFVPNDNAAA